MGKSIIKYTTIKRYNRRCYLQQCPEPGMGWLMRRVTELRNGKFKVKNLVTCETTIRKVL